MTSRLAVPIRRTLAALGLLLAPFAPSSFAQDAQYRDGRFLQALGGVTIQRADEASSDEAVLNMPFLPGDRVWTDNSGRAEIVFAEGEILWIAERSKVDSLGRGGREQDERLGLRVFAGSFGARVRPGGPGFEFRAPGGSITTTGAAAFRVDVQVGETVISVSEGEVLADLGGERRTVREGERVTYADGRADGPVRYDRTSTDAFDRWCEDREAELSRMARDRNPDRLPEELGAYGAELDRNGDWVYDEPQGYVYVPRVSYDWAPYTYGRWVYTLYGWTWVADEPWGFVTSHYGRWGYSSRIGWHWLPRTGFSGAWVSWSTPVGRWSNTIGWCALGFNDRPIGSLGYAANRGSGFGPADNRSNSAGRGWSFTNRADMGRGNVHRRLVNVPAEDAQQAVVWNQGSAPDREFREARRGTAETRTNRGSFGAEATRPTGRGEGRPNSGADRGARVYLRPSPGDSTPELRSDPATTIPTPESRRARTIGQDGFKDEQDNRRSRSRRDDPGSSTDPSASSRPDSARQRQADHGTTGSPNGSPDESARAEVLRGRTANDPLLNRFFRSITRPESAERGSAPSRNSDSSARRDEPQPRSDSSTRRDEPQSHSDSSARERTPQRDDSSTRSRTPPSRDDSSARDNDSRERSRPQGARPQESRPSPSDGNRERARPSGGERSQPRGGSAPPRSTPQSGSSSDRGSRPKPHDDH